VARAKLQAIRQNMQDLQELVTKFEQDKAKFTLV
jgi:hypothetical protein